MTATIPLSAPVEAHGETLRELTLRRPTGRDLRIAGTVYKLTAEGEIAVQAAAMHRMIAQLAGVPPSTIDLLDGADWEAASQAILGFTMSAPAPETKAPA